MYVCSCSRLCLRVFVLCCDLMCFAAAFDLVCFGLVWLGLALRARVLVRFAVAFAFALMCFALLCCCVVFC